MELTTNGGQHLGINDSMHHDETMIGLKEPLTAGTVMKKGSMGTLESEFTAD